MTPPLCAICSAPADGPPRTPNGFSLCAECRAALDVSYPLPKSADRDCGAAEIETVIDNLTPDRA